MQTTIMVARARIVKSQPPWIGARARNAGQRDGSAIATPSIAAIVFFRKIPMTRSGRSVSGDKSTSAPAGQSRRSVTAARNRSAAVLPPGQDDTSGAGRLGNPSDIDPLRIRVLRGDAPDEAGEYVLYWMVAHRRLTWNHALQRAVAWCRHLNKPLWILEPLRCDYEWASLRTHAFFLEGMQEHATILAGTGVGYFPYLEPKPGQSRGLLAAMAEKAAVVVTDDYPCLFLPRMLEAAADRLSTRLEAVDSNGVLPMRLAEKTFARAVDFRRFMHRSIAEQSAGLPLADPLRDLPVVAAPPLASKLLKTWAPTPVSEWDHQRLVTLPIDASVPPAPVRGGMTAAQNLLSNFLTRKLSQYEDQRRNVDQVGTSQLSPYLRFGHLAAAEVVARVWEHEGWTPGSIQLKAVSKNAGFWGVSSAAESFLDELITWREIGFNMCHRNPEYDQYTSLPDWAQRTLAEHANDSRPAVYSLEQFEAAATHDEIWNAAQRQLVRDGIIHNYLRMLWGKKILHWAASPRDALNVMIHLNNKYAIDGRDPNSYSGIFWVLGRYDRAWGPEREVFGQIRYMTSDSTAKKLSLSAYLRRYRAL